MLALLLGLLLPHSLALEISLLLARSLAFAPLRVLELLLKHVLQFLHMLWRALSLTLLFAWALPPLLPPVLPLLLPLALARLLALLPAFLFALA